MFVNPETSKANGLGTVSLAAPRDDRAPAIESSFHVATTIAVRPFRKKLILAATQQQHFQTSWLPRERLLGSASLKHRINGCNDVPDSNNTRVPSSLVSSVRTHAAHSIARTSKHSGPSSSCLLRIQHRLWVGSSNPQVAMPHLPARSLF